MLTVHLLNMKIAVVTTVQDAGGVILTQRILQKMCTSNFSSIELKSLHNICRCMYLLKILYLTLVECMCARVGVVNITFPYTLILFACQEVSNYKSILVLSQLVF